jgi:hypothetical protein
MLLLFVTAFLPFDIFDFNSSLIAFNCALDFDEDGYSIRLGLLLLDDDELFVFWYLILDMFVLINLLFIVDGGLGCLLLMMLLLIF